MKFYKFLTYLLILVVLFSAGVLILGPTLISTEAGKEKVLAWIDQKIPGRFKIDDLSLSWFGQSDVTGIELLDEQGYAIAKIDALHLKTSLARLLFTSTAEPQISVRGLNATLVADQNGVTNLERALSFESNKLPVSTLLDPLLLKDFNIVSEITPSSSPRAKVYAQGNTEQGNINGQLTVTGELGKQPVLNIQGTRLPMLLLDQLVHLNASSPSGLLLKIFGKEMDINVKVNGDQLKQQVKTPTFASSYVGDIKNNIFTLTEGSSELVLTPEAFNSLKKLLNRESLPSIDQNQIVQIKINSLTIPLNDPKNGSGNLELHLSGSPLFQLDATGNIDGQTTTLQGTFKGQGIAAENFLLKSNSINLETLLEEDITTLPLEGTISAERILFEGIEAKLQESAWKFDGKNETASLDFHLIKQNIPLDGTLSTNRWGERVDFNLSQNSQNGFAHVNGFVERPLKDDRSLHVTGDLKRFPVDLLALLSPSSPNLSNKLHALFGNEVSGNLKAQLERMNGPFSLSLSGERCKLNVDAVMHNQELTLRSPLTMELTVNKDVSDYFLDEIAPLLNSATRADAPLTLLIPVEGFRLPLNDIRIETVTIHSATLTLGKIYFTRQGKLAEVMSLLNLPTNEELSVWFTPLYFSIQNGMLQLARLDMLISNTVPLATWGSINFQKDYVNMEVGLTGRALANSFGPLPLPKSYMLAIPLRGPTSNPKLDKTKIAAKLSSFAAMATGPQGILVGALIQLASGTFTDKIPEPTTKPLPWDIDSPVAPTEENESKSSIPIEKPVKEIKKGAEKLINKILGG